MESKANHTTISVRRDTFNRIVDLRDGLYPRETLQSFMEHMAEIFEKVHCPECSKYLAIINHCNCKDSEKL
jgi:hypothetical protein